MKRSIAFIILKVFILQSFFWLTTKYGPLGYGNIIFGAGLTLMVLNYFFIKEIINWLPYTFLTLLFFLSGFVLDTLLIHYEFLPLASPYPPIWFPTLWMIFLAYYGDVFNKMLSMPIWLMAFLGSIGGSLAYYRGLSNVEVQLHEYFYFIIGITWALFMPFSLIIFRYFKDKKKG